MTGEGAQFDQAQLGIVSVLMFFLHDMDWTGFILGDANWHQLQSLGISVGLHN